MNHRRPPHFDRGRAFGQRRGAYADAAARRRVAAPLANDPATPHADLAAFVELALDVRRRRFAEMPQRWSQVERWGDSLERSAASDPDLASRRGLIVLESIGAPPHERGDAARATARLRRATTLALAYAGRLQEAVAIGELNHADSATAGEGVESARALLSLMQPLLKLGRTGDAVAAGERAHAAFLEASRPELAARADINLANIRKVLGESDATLRHLDRARDELGDDPALLAHIENTRGETLMALDRFGEAHRAYTTSLEWARRAGAGFASAVIEGNLADLAARSGALHEALEHYARARSGVAAAAGHSARLLLEEADVLWALGLAPVALERLREGLARVDRLGLAFEGARAALSLCRAFAELGDHESAERLAADAAGRAERLGDSPGAARAMTLGALIRAKRGDVDGAKAALARAATLAPTPTPSDRVVRLMTESAVAARRGDLDRALEWGRQAAALAEAIGAAPLEADSFVQLARLHRSAGDPSAALEPARRAVAAAEGVRSGLGAELLRRSYLGRSVDAYEELTLASLEHGGLGGVIEALRAADDAKSRSLCDRLLSTGAATMLAPGTSGPLSDRAEVREARSELESAYRQLSVAPELVPELRTRIISLERRLERLEIDAIGALARASQPVEHEILDPCALLAPDEAVVEYTRCVGRWLAFIVRSDGVRVVPLGSADAEIAAAIGRLGFQVRRALRDSRAGRSTPLRHAIDALDALGEAIWSPLARAIELPARVIVVPHAALHGVPFAALRDRGEWLIDRHEITSIPSLGVLGALRTAGRSRHRAPPKERGSSGSSPAHAAARASQRLVVGVADERAPGIREEAAAVARLLGAESVLGADATADRVASMLPRFDLAHVACHGQFLPEAPWSSGLKFADRWFGVRDVLALADAPRTVILSGCETATHDVVSGDELVGLVHAFLARGAESVLASLWSAHDASTTRLMLDLHAALRNRDPCASLAEDLRAAQRAERERSPHPAFWAPFTLTEA